MLKFSNTEACWQAIAQAPLAFGAPRGVDLIDGPYTFAGVKKWFGKADMAGIVFCVAFSGQRQHAKRIVTAIKGHLKTIASTHDEFAVTVRETRWELSDGNTRALLYKALLLQKLRLLEGKVPVDYTYDDLPQKVRVSFTECETAEQSLDVYKQYNSKEAVKSTRDEVHTALKMTAGESGLELRSEFFRNEGAIATASEYAFFSSRAKPAIAVKTMQPVLPALDAMGLTRKAGERTTLPGGAVAALAVLAGIDRTRALEFAEGVFAAEVDLAKTNDLTYPELFARRVYELKATRQFSSAAALRPAVAELVGIVVAYAASSEKHVVKVPVAFREPMTVPELYVLAETKHPMLASVFARRDTLLGKVKPVVDVPPANVTTEADTQPLAA